jgi:hypothetical protein
MRFLLEKGLEFSEVLHNNASRHWTQVDSMYHPRGTAEASFLLAFWLFFLKRMECRAGTI